MPNKNITDPNLRKGRIKIQDLKSKYQESWEAVDRKVRNICIKIGNDLFLWAAISKDKNKKLKGFTFYLLDLDGASLYDDIMKTGYIELQSQGQGKSFNILTKDGKMFSKGDVSGKYFNLAPEFVQNQINQADTKLRTEGQTAVNTKDVNTTYGKSTKISIKVDPLQNKGTKFNYDEVSKQVFSTILDILTDTQNMSKIVASIPV